MNVSMHQVRLANAQAYESSDGIQGFADFEEQHGRNGTLSMYFGSAEDCQKAADRLAELARQMTAGAAFKQKISGEAAQKPGRMLRLREVQEMTGRCRSSIYGDMAAGAFPRPVKIGAQSVAWPESVIRKWVEDKINGADHA